MTANVNELPMFHGLVFIDGLAEIQDVASHSGECLCHKCGKEKLFLIPMLYEDNDETPESVCSVVALFKHFHVVDLGSDKDIFPLWLKQIVVNEARCNGS